MSRQSQRLRGTFRNYQSEDTGNNGISGESSLLSVPQALFVENSNSRTLRRKPSRGKRLSPTPSLGISSPHTTSYYSESVIKESYLTDDRGLSLKTNVAFDEPLESSSYWNDDLLSRRRRGTGGIESNKKINELGDRKTYDTYCSSSGYSSEDDYTGGSSMDQNTSSFGFQTVLSKVGSFIWLVLLAPGRFLGLLYWWMGTMWYRLTTIASLLDVFILTRSYPVLKKIMLFMLLLLLLSSVGYGAWYFYPFGLQPSMFPWGAVKLFPSGTKKDQEMGETAVFSEAQQQALSRVQAVERRLEILEFQKRKNIEGATLSHEDTLVLLDGLMTQQEAAMREKLGSDIDLHLQKTLSAFRSQMQKEFDSLLQKVSETCEKTLNAFRSQMQKEFDSILQKVSETSEKTLGAFRSQMQKEFVSLQKVSENSEQVHQIVNDALKRYSEDRIGMVDYALESAGASIISTRCSETYETKTALLSLFGIPLWYNYHSPRVILQPDVYPGNCWAFQGSQGFAVIHLSNRIHPTAVTLEHISKSLSPSRTITSAPKDIAVYGLEEEGDQEGILLGKFMYNQDGDPIQTFHFQDIDGQAAFQLVELKVLSNWGHPEYTCIYRFRVHGELVS
ncbi:SUN domain-containing protein 2 isoform X2 [Erythrolamprus reginae]|uniref:SUN domain-containing protein 2 isoform X2 n=1 Tax=Erythrolamprus reginae TaxID=121349 RepID=UPI00396CB02C